MARSIRILLLVALAVVLGGSPARAAYVEFASLLGVSFSAPSGASTGHVLDGYGLTGITADFYGFSWYGAGSWQAGFDPGAGDPARLQMVQYRGEYGLGVGVQPSNPPLNNLPATGVNEIDSREGLLLAFNQPVYLSSFTLGNFFNDTSSASNPSETGWVVLDGNYALPYNFTAPATQLVGGGTPGTYVVTLPSPVLVTSIAFFASSQIPGQSWSSDYLVRGVDVAQAGAPEPGSLLLFGSATGVAAWLRRRRRRAA